MTTETLIATAEQSVSPFCPTAPAEPFEPVHLLTLNDAQQGEGQRITIAKGALSMSTSGSFSISSRKESIPLASGPLSDDDTISRYLSLAGGLQWANCREELLTVLLESGHTVDIDDSTDDLCHVVVGKNGLTLSGKGESIGIALCEAVLAYIRFTGAVRRDQEAGTVNLARSAMPFYTALSWMLLGRKVRRVIWDAEISLSLKPGVISVNQELVHGRLLGVPAEYYNYLSGQNVERQEPTLLLHLSNHLAHVWQTDHASLLATDWELVAE